MTNAYWNDVLIAKSDDVVRVDGNAYFPADAVTPGVLKDSATTSVCGWKGTANYYTLVAGGAENKDAAWYYDDPKDAAANIRGRVAFWKGVRVG